MNTVGIVSYNMYGNFTNYGSALQTYALHKAIDRLVPGRLQSIVVDYCPDVLADKDVLNPIDNMWDTDPAARERCRLSLPAIRENYEKFKRFYKEHYRLSSGKYTTHTVGLSLGAENLCGFVCGSDTIFSVPEFGFDDGFYANTGRMKRHSVAFAASFGDYEVAQSDMPELRSRLSNFKAIALRERDKLRLVESLTDRPVYKVTDPTLLLDAGDYASIVEEPDISVPYMLVYSRRGDERMMQFAEQLAQSTGWQTVEISLNAHNANRHIMRYDAGVEEFLGLVKNAQAVVTNSFHGMIFAARFERPFYVFSRKLCDTKIAEMLDMFDIKGRLLTTGNEPMPEPIDYQKVTANIRAAREESIRILQSEINCLLQ